MIEFLIKFFLYTKQEDGSFSSFSDNLGKGAFSDWRHFFWIFLSVFLCVALYRLFSQHKKAGRITVVVLVSILFIFRLFHQSLRAYLGVEDPVWKALPFHLCTVMTFLMPVVVIFKLNKLKTAVYVMSMIGGIVTILLGDYFDSKFLNIYALEGMYAHTLLLLVPIIEIALGNFKLEIKRIWEVCLGMLLAMGWATLANDVFFKNYDNNYMYLKHNGLPGDIGGKYYFLIYVLLYVVFIFFIFGIPVLYRYLKSTRKQLAYN